MSPPAEGGDLALVPDAALGASCESEPKRACGRTQLVDRNTRRRTESPKLDVRYGLSAYGTSATGAGTSRQRYGQLRHALLCRSRRSVRGDEAGPLRVGRVVGS